MSMLPTSLPGTTGGAGFWQGCLPILLFIAAVFACLLWGTL